MAVPHAESGQVVDVRPLGSRIAGAVTTVLINGPHVEVIRLVVPAGKEIPPHKVSGPITIQCVEGRLAFTASGKTQELAAGEMCYLTGGEEHAVKGLEDSTALVTIVR